MRRRSVMADQVISDAKYPLMNGRHEFSDGSYVEVTNGNHVKIVGDTSNYASINFTNINNNTDSPQNYDNSKQNVTYPLKKRRYRCIKIHKYPKGFYECFWI